MSNENGLSRNVRRLVITSLCVCLVGFLILAGGIWLMKKVWFIRTDSPTWEQVGAARLILCIDPDLEIESLGYESWSGVGDWTHGLKFVAQTEDPATIFDPLLIDSTGFSTPYDDRAMDRCQADWWNLPAGGFSGGSFRVKRDGTPWRQDVWYRDTGEGTILVYVFSESG